MPTTSETGQLANWMVGEQLSLVLHVGDGPVAYALSEVGHDVTIVGDDVRAVRNPDISYVRCQGELLPFRSSSFDAVVVPDLDDSPLALAEYARVLTRSGLLSTVNRHYDDSVPWMRRLRAITGDIEPRSAASTFDASGLFRTPQTREFNAWEDLDLPGLMRFAETTRRASVPPERLAEVSTLWQEFGVGTGSLRLRHETVCTRARVDKSALPAEPEPPDVVLIDFK